MGGGVWKKRIDENRSRAIVLAKAGSRWIFEYLFAKADRANLKQDELAGFRELASAYVGLTAAQLAALIDNGSLKEICHDTDDA